MATGNLSNCMPVILAYEGGYTADKRDPGNWTGGKVGVGKLLGTKYGVAAASFPNLDIKGLTVKDVEPIYAQKYWRPIRGDDLPFGIDLATFDFGVNSGIGRAAKYLQAVLGVPADGKIGAATLKAAVIADKKETIQKLCARRLGFLKSLAIWKTYKGGWSKRVANVEARAVALYLASGGKLHSAHVADLESEAAKADSKAKTQQQSAASATGGGAAIGGGDTLITGQPDWLLIAGLGVLVIVVVVAVLVKASQNRDRAEAYKAVAAAG